MTQDPSRWLDQPPPPGTAQARAAERLARLAPPRPLDPAAKARIAAQLPSTPAPTGLSRAGKLGLVGLLLAGAGISGWALLRERAPAFTGPVASPSPRSALSPVDAPAPEASAAPEPSSKAPATAPNPGPGAKPKEIDPPPAPGAKRTGPRESQGAPPAIAATTPPAASEAALPAIGGPSPLELEARSLAEIVRTLREEKDAAGALTRLAVHRRAFPHGILVPEADVVELDAHVAQGDRAAALGLLDRLDPAHDRGLPRRGELLALWADLLAEDARCDRAATLYAQLLTEPVGSGLQERALWGKAHCLGREGDVAAARSVLEEYLRRFPDGKFAETARRQLAR